MMTGYILKFHPSLIKRRRKPPKGMLKVLLGKQENLGTWALIGTNESEILQVLGASAAKLNAHRLRFMELILYVLFSMNTCMQFSFENI